MTAEHGRQRGFSSVELLVALLLTLLVAAAAAVLAGATAGVAQVQPEALDMQQRVRAGGGALFRDLIQAGAGLDVGPTAGPLVAHLPPIVPRRMGRTGADGPLTARSDALTVIYVPTTTTQTSLAAPLPSATAPLILAAGPGCPGGSAQCGLRSRDTLLVFDDLGNFDLLTVTATGGGGATVAAHRSDGTSTYQAGATVAGAVVYSYYFDAARRQLRRYDGLGSDVPVVDHVVGVRFEFLGDPLPPTSPRPPLGTANCLFDAVGAPQAGLVTLGAQGGSLAALPPGMLSDGPWCGAGDNRYDADLLRIRHVKVRLRVEASPAVLRSQGADWVTPGTSREATRSLADYRSTFSVTPRNLNLGR